jgi:serine/threonine protein kinase
MLLSLEYLHSKNIIHRDIKPENIVISADSHFKLTDFGISEAGFNKNKYAITNFDANEEDLVVKTDKILGTDHYLAPEILNDEPITYQFDYWSLGVLIYELYANNLPFMAENFAKISDNILNLRINWEPFDSLIDSGQYSISQLQDAKDLISKFLVIDPNERWGFNNIEECKNHAFFKNFDWKNIKNITDPLVKKYVIEQIREVNKKPTEVNDSIENIKKEEANDNQLHNNDSKVNDQDVTIEYETKNFLTSERIDNLYLMCQDVLKKNIQKKTLNIDAGDEKFTDIMNDMMG